MPVRARPLVYGKHDMRRRARIQKAAITKQLLQLRLIFSLACACHFVLMSCLAQGLGGDFVSILPGGNLTSYYSSVEKAIEMQTLPVDWTSAWQGTAPLYGSLFIFPVPSLHVRALCLPCCAGVVQPM